MALTAPQILEFYRTHGFRLVFWADRDDAKGPTGKSAIGWTEREYRYEDYKPGDRLGIMCGVEIAPGKFLHDYDIDYGPCAVVAQSLLPATGLVYGRESKKVSHCFYTTSEALPSFRYEDPTDKQCLLELRGTKLDGTIGNQTMAPPSVWSKSGAREALAFVSMRAPTHIDEPNALRQSGCLAAIGMLLARHFGRQGFNHDTRLAWAGFMLRAGLSVDECSALGKAIIAFTGNKDNTDIALAITSTAKRLESKDKKVKGGPALARMMGDNGRMIVKRINEWLGRDSDFIRNKDGIIVKDSQENILRALNLLNVDLGYNEFSERMTLNRTAPLEDRQLTELWFRIDEEYRFRPPFEFFERALKRIAWNNGYHPVREWLTSLQWDGVNRLEEWLIQAAGAAETPYVRAVSAIVLIAAVRRVRNPGCKYDEMLVLESQQGMHKSSALRALCPHPEWFTDDFQLNVTAQRMIESTLGKWVIEVSELSGMSKALVELLKANLSRSVDGPARMAYARLPIERARQFVLIGTTNSKSYLADQTGGRRFWPMEVSRFDVEWIAQHRDQLWAEAAARETAGQSCRLPEALWNAAGEQQEKRREIDPWEPLIKSALHAEPLIHDYRDNHTRIVTTRLWNIVGVPHDRQGRRDQIRLSEIMQRLGFARTRLRPKGEPVQVGYESVKPYWCHEISLEDLETAQEVHATTDEGPAREDAPF